MNERAGTELGPGQPPVVLLDANVLYSKVLSDYLVHAQYRGLVRLRWSSRILDEVIRNMKAKAAKRYSDPRDLGRRLAAADGLRDYIERTHPTALVDPSENDFAQFAHLAMPDPDDRHVVAAAVSAGADYLCTANTSDFPVSIMERLGMRRITPDVLLNGLVTDKPLEMVHAHQQVIAWTPGTTHRATLDTLRRSQAPVTADRMERLLMSLGDLDKRDDLARIYIHAVAERDRAYSGMPRPYMGGRNLNASVVWQTLGRPGPHRANQLPRQIDS